MQIFDEEQAERFSFDVLDSTKIIPEELVPVTPIGRMVLNRNPDNFFAETEQVAFCTAHVVPGIDFTNDPLLAGRIHSGQALEFVIEPFRHAKPIMVINDGRQVLEDAGVPLDEGDSGLVITQRTTRNDINAFIEAIAQHRHPARETDPPKV